MSESIRPTTAARVFGAAFALAGVAGFVPNPVIGPDGLFLTNGAHNAVHLATAALFFAFAARGERAALLFTRAFGIVYLLVGALGFAVLAGGPEGRLVGLVHINRLDNFLHVGLGALLAIAGFAVPRRRASARAATVTGLLLLALVPGAAPAADAVNTSTGLTAAGGPLAVHGYDVVAYFTDGGPRRGLAEHSTLWRGAVYRFASAEHLEAFRADPERYVPRFGGFCAYGVSVGKKFDGDPEVWAVVDGALYLNLNREIQGIWEEDVAGRVAEAGRRWPAIEHRPAGDL